MTKTKQKSSIQKRNLILVLISLLFLFTGFVLIKVSKKQSATSPDVTENQVTEPFVQRSELDQSGATILTVHPSNMTNYSVLSLTAPRDWAIQEKQGDNLVSLIKNDYELSLSHPEVGGGVCVFPDTDVTDLPQTFADNPVIKNYVEIKFEQGVLRRHAQLYPSQDPSKMEYIICENVLKEPSDVFEVPTNGAFIRYSTPINPSAGMLREMDAILESLQYK